MKRILVVVGISLISVIAAGVAWQLVPHGDWWAALTDGGRRAVSAAPVAEPLAWKELGVGSARDACLFGDTLVTLSGAGNAVTIWLQGENQQTSTIAERRFVNAVNMSCDQNNRTILVADQGTSSIHIMDAQLDSVTAFAAPQTPQDLPILGDYTLSDSGFVESWLGTDSKLGPFLEEGDFTELRLVRRWSIRGDSIGAFGALEAFDNAVARRVFNRPFLLVVRDTTWVLVQGLALLKGFDPTGKEVARIQLPVYERGRRPSISIGPVLSPSSALRSNDMDYRPSVAGLAAFGDSLFAIGRLHTWAFAIGGMAGSRSIIEHAKSSIEVVNKRGAIVGTFEVPGMISRLRSDGKNRLVAIILGRDRRQKAYAADVYLSGTCSINDPSVCRLA
jgi:hypothetical protein